ncbi:MAG: hypothetical protein MJZ37_06280 [Bacilli bacterium]|nr:hypothetical protein [Bacilli bacterium]
MYNKFYDDDYGDFLVQEAKDEKVLEEAEREKQKKEFIGKAVNEIMRKWEVKLAKYDSPSDKIANMLLSEAYDETLAEMRFSGRECAWL